MLIKTLTFLIFINAENSCAAQYFCGKRDIFYFSGFFDEQKEQHLFETETFCDIIHVFTDTFDQFNARLINKSINCFQKHKTILLTQNFWIVMYTNI